MESWGGINLKKIHLQKKKNGISKMNAGKHTLEEYSLFMFLKDYLFHNFLIHENNVISENQVKVF